MFRCLQKLIIAVNQKQLATQIIFFDHRAIMQPYSYRRRNVNQAICFKFAEMLWTLAEYWGRGLRARGWINLIALLLSYWSAYRFYGESCVHVLTCVDSFWCSCIKKDLTNPFLYIIFKIYRTCSVPALVVANLKTVLDHSLFLL